MYTFDNLEIGQSFRCLRTITMEDVRQFALVTGDDNPIHVDEEYAGRSRFGKPVVHGVLLLGIISKVLGRDFPGHGSIAVSIACRFLRPVPVGSEIAVEVKVAEKIEKHRHVKGRVYIYLGSKMILSGEAVLIPPEPEEAEPTAASEA